MARARKAECPECGCTNIGKERMFGVQTGDYVYRECGHTRETANKSCNLGIERGFERPA